MRNYIIGVGAQKSGTSWIGKYFEDHPDVFMSPMKELHYFDDIFNKNNRFAFKIRRIKNLSNMVHGSKRKEIVESLNVKESQVNLLASVIGIDSLSSYRNYFESRCSDSSKKLCEITPAYSILGVDGFEAIKSISAKVKIFFVMRDPIDRAWSAIKFSKKDTNDLTEISKKEIEAFVSDKENLSRGNYKRTINDISKVFNEDDFLVMFYEDLFTDKSIKKLCDFADIKYMSASLSSKVNVTNKIEMPVEVKEFLLESFHEQYEWAFDYFGDQLPKVWLDNYRACYEKK